MYNSHQAFFELLRAGLWEKEARLSRISEVNYDEIMRLTEEQSVVGLVTAGLEHVTDVKLPKDDVLKFVGKAVQLEQRNQAMNQFVGGLIEKLRKEDVYTLLLKGQGIAQCYERPLWRACGDVDLLLSDENYDKAKEFLIPLAGSVDSEEPLSKHLGMTINSWVVELHGSLRSGLSAKMDKGLDEINSDIFYGGNVRSWLNGGTLVFVPSAENDALYVFTHIMNHFYRGGIGIRQICDWCRLLWTYRDSLNYEIIKSRLLRMGLMTEWKVFGAFAVEYLGMPAEAMPYYSLEKKWKRKADKVFRFVMEVGNFGHNRDNSYYSKTFIIRKAISFRRRCGDLMSHARIFPMDSLRYLPGIVFNGVKVALKGDHNN